MKCKTLLILPCLVLSSCGVSLDKTAAYGIDHSGNWHDNYYTVFSNELKQREVKEVVLNRSVNKVFTYYNDPVFKLVEPHRDNYKYAEDYDEQTGYGPNFKLSKANESLKDGFVSKLFDGTLFCHGRYEKARIQINEDGFSSSFNRPLQYASYLYLNFKSAIDFKTYKDVGSHLDKITLSITLYGDTATKFSYQIDNVPTNDGENYLFYGFSLNGFDLTNVTDFSISYKLDYDAVKEIAPQAEHALLLYEFGFGNPTFK